VLAKYKRKLIRFIRRKLKNRKFILILFAVSLLTIGFTYTEYMQNKRRNIDPTTCSQLLHLIAKAESQDNYNAYFGHVHNSSINFTKMSIADVMKWQSQYIDEGNASSAVGKYQIINTTLSGLVKELNIDNSQLFDERMQNKMAITLIKRRGAEAYVNRELTQKEFAANLAKEWASLPRVVGDKPEQSYYAYDGLNQSLVSIEEVMKAIDAIKPKL
jgi:muramidase (phage lysozyme)